MGPPCQQAGPLQGSGLISRWERQAPHSSSAATADDLRSAPRLAPLSAGDHGARDQNGARDDLRPWCPCATVHTREGHTASAGMRIELKRAAWGRNHTPHILAGAYLLSRSINESFVACTSCSQARRGQHETREMRRPQALRVRCAHVRCVRGCACARVCVWLSRTPNLRCASFHSLSAFSTSGCCGDGVKSKSEPKTVTSQLRHKSLQSSAFGLGVKTGPAIRLRPVLDAQLLHFWMLWGWSEE